MTALAVFTVAAVTHGCVDDAGCELLGKCVAGRCNCLPGFVGATCGRLDLLPAPAKTRGQVWPQAPMPESLRHTMAWSFAPFRDPATGGYGNLYILDRTHVRISPISQLCPPLHPPCAVFCVVPRLVGS